MRSETLFVNSPISDQVTVRVPEGKRCRIIAVSFNWTGGAGIYNNDGCTVQIFSPVFLLAQASMFLAGVTGSGTFALGAANEPAVPTFIVVPPIGNPLWMSPRPGAPLPNMWLAVPVITIGWRAMNTALQNNLTAAYELEDRT